MSYLSSCGGYFDLTTELTRWLCCQTWLLVISSLTLHHGSHVMMMKMAAATEYECHCVSNDKDVS